MHRHLFLSLALTFVVAGLGASPSGAQSAGQEADQGAPIAPWAVVRPGSTYYGDDVEVAPQNAVIFAQPKDAPEGTELTLTLAVNEGEESPVEIEEQCAGGHCLYTGALPALEEGDTAVIRVTGEEGIDVAHPFEVGPADDEPPTPLQIDLDTLYLQPEDGHFIQTFDFGADADLEEKLADIAMIEVLERKTEGAEDTVLSRSVVLSGAPAVYDLHSVDLLDDTEREACFAFVFHDAAGNSAQSEDLCTTISVDEAEVTGGSGIGDLVVGCSSTGAGGAALPGFMLLLGLVGLARRRR